MCRTRLAENTGRKRSRQKSPSGHHCTTLSGYIFATKAQVESWKKNLLSSNMSSTCPHNMVNFGRLTAEIGSGVWGTPADFNGFRVLAALLHGSQVVSVSQTSALNRGRHLCSAGRPSRWALAHILVVITSPARGVVKYCDEYVCLCVCLSDRISPEPHARSLPIFLCMLPMSMALSSSGMFTIGRIACRREGIFLSIDNAL